MGPGFFDWGLIDNSAIPDPVNYFGLSKTMTAHVSPWTFTFSQEYLCISSFMIGLLGEEKDRRREMGKGERERERERERENLTKPSAGEDVEQLELSYIADRDVKIMQPLRK